MLGTPGPGSVRRRGHAWLDTTPLPAGISVVVPVYNSAEALPELVERLEQVLRAVGEPFEVVLVNDGSRDESWTVVRQLAVPRPWLRPVDLMRNYGQHNALLCGIRIAAYSVVVTIDDDLQHPPEEIPLLLEALEAGADVVYGTPLGEKHGAFRRVSSWITKVALQTTMGAETASRVSAMRAFRTQVSRAFADYGGSFVSIDVLLTWGTKRFKAVPVRHDPRRHGESNYTFAKLAVHALNMITGFSTWPLQLASLLGFTFTLMGVGVFAYVLIRLAIERSSVPGFPFLASIVAIFSGAQLFALGIVGEYLARVHLRTMDRPPFLVRTIEGPRELGSAGLGGGAEPVGESRLEVLAQDRED